MADAVKTAPLAPTKQILLLSRYQADTYGFFFLNINGIPLSRPSLMEMVVDSQESQLDWLGVVETHLDTEKFHVQDMIKSTIHSSRGYRYANYVFSSSSLSFGSDYKPGGVL